MLRENPKMKQTVHNPQWHRPTILGYLLFTLCAALIGAQVALADPAVTATYTFIQDKKNQLTILVTGAGATITLADIQSGLGAANADHLVNLGNGVWRLNTNLWIDEDVTLLLSPQNGVNELQLRSDNNGAVTSSAINEIESIDAIEYPSFVYLKTENGSIHLDSVKVYSWDTAANAVDTNYSNGRAYILAKLDATLTVQNADIGYLGSADGESYGLSWRDINSTTEPNVLRTRVTGQVLNSKIHHNYYGIYTYQAQNMTFRGNEFHSNVRYGFDPHDYTHHVLVEDNLAYNNGAHGFIISRGCNNFTFRNNKSYNNVDPGTNLAHGFMLDPGGASASDPQVSSSNNLLENNESYNNEGYGLRLLGSSDNEIRNNYFHHNDTGMTIDGAAVTSATTRNLVRGNRFEANTKTGIFLREAPQNEIRENIITGNLGSGLDIRKATQNKIEANTITGNGIHGVILSDSAQQNSLLGNTIQNNKSYGINITASTTTGNHWSQNLITGNLLGGIFGGAQLLAAPVLQTVTGNTVSGQAPANVTVEIFADNGAQGQFYIGQTPAGSDGSFTFTSNTGWTAPNVTAIAVAPNTNASPFSGPVPASTNTTPTGTPTATATTIVINTVTATATATPTPLNSPTSTPTNASDTPTVTPTPSSTATLGATPTVTPTPSSTVTPDATPTAIATTTGTSIATPTVTTTVAATATNTVIPGATSTMTPTVTPTTHSTPGGSGELNYNIYLPAISR